MSLVALYVAAAIGGSVLAGGLAATGHWTLMGLATVLSVGNWLIALLGAYCEGFDKARTGAK